MAVSMALAMAMAMSMAMTETDGGWRMADVGVHRRGAVEVECSVMKLMDGGGVPGVADESSTGKRQRIDLQTAAVGQHASFTMNLRMRRDEMRANERK